VKIKVKYQGRLRRFD